MNNFSNGERLIGEAKEIFLTLTALYTNRSWNMVVRRAQEVVELSLKGLLKIMGIDYPKVHDVGAILKEKLRERKILQDEEKLSEIEEISSYLAKQRSPAFYYEKVYTEEEAKRAKDYAKKILGFVNELVKRLR